MDVMKNGDGAAWGHLLGFNNGPAEANALRRIKQDKNFYNELNPIDKMNVLIGNITQHVREEYEKHYGEKLLDGRKVDKELAKNPMYYNNLVEQADQLSDDTKQVYVQPTFVTPQTDVGTTQKSEQNNNYWNLRYAGQNGAVPDNPMSTKPFAKFTTPREGVIGADNQLQLYASGNSKAAHYRPLTTIADIITVASPESDGNKTSNMIAGASNELGVRPDERLDFSTPTSRAKILHALFGQEGNHPYTTDQINQIIQGNDSRTPLYLAPQESSVNAPSGKEEVNAKNINSTALNSVEISNAIVNALKDNKMQVEITLMDKSTGEKKTILGTGGGKITTSMTYQ